MNEEIPQDEIRVDDCVAGEMRRGIRNFKSEYFLIVKQYNPITDGYLYAIGIETGAWVNNPNFTVER